MQAIENNQKIKLVGILGPTSSGKTSLAVDLCKTFNGEIISADSRQVYIGMDLGTGKEGHKAIVNLPVLGDQPARIIEGIPQFLVDIIEPSDIYTVADFQKQSRELIENMAARNKLPFVVGGTNLYIQALLEGYQIPRADSKEKKIRHKLEKFSKIELLEKLKSLDIQSYNQIDPTNTRRIIRALSVTLATGKPFSQQQKKANQSIYEPLLLAVLFDRKILYENIDRRVDERIKLGMVEEIENLIKKGISPQKLITFGLEYKYVTKYLLGEVSKEQMVTELKFAIHHFARRQLTWLNNRLNVEWVENKSKAEKLIVKFLRNSSS